VSFFIPNSQEWGELPSIDDILEAARGKAINIDGPYEYRVQGRAERDPWIIRISDGQKSYSFLEDDVILSSRLDDGTLRLYQTGFSFARRPLWLTVMFMRNFCVVMFGYRRVDSFCYARFVK